MNKLPISFEFSAPKTADATAALLRSQDRLKGFDPEYVSVTYGAGGSTRDGTKEAAIALGQGAVPIAPHLSFGGDTPATISALLDEYQEAGIHRLVALRGDRQSGFGRSKMSHAFESAFASRLRVLEFTSSSLPSFSLPSSPIPARFAESRKKAADANAKRERAPPTENDS